MEPIACEPCSLDQASVWYVFVLCACAVWFLGDTCCSAGPHCHSHCRSTSKHHCDHSTLMHLCRTPDHAGSKFTAIHRIQLHASVRLYRVFTCEAALPQASFPSQAKLTVSTPYIPPAPQYPSSPLTTPPLPFERNAPYSTGWL